MKQGHDRQETVQGCTPVCWNLMHERGGCGWWSSQPYMMEQAADVAAAVAAATTIPATTLAPICTDSSWSVSLWWWIALVLCGVAPCGFRLCKSWLWCLFCDDFFSFACLHVPHTWWRQKQRTALWWVLSFSSLQRQQNHFATIILLSPITKLAYKKQQQLHLLELNFNPRPNLPAASIHNEHKP